MNGTNAMPAGFPRRTGFTLIGALAAAIAIASPAAAPPGDLDPTFGGDGKVTTDFAGDFDLAPGMAIQGDGKIVAAGFAVVSGTDDFALARYNTDGSLDTTFDGDGRVTTDFAGAFDSADEVAIQGDGKIVAVGSARASGTSDFALARYNTDGSLDPTFGTDGKVTTDFVIADEARGVAIQGDGKIVAAGAVGAFGNRDFAVARYNTDGSLDTTFSADGKATTDFAGGDDQAFGVALQGDGKIVTAGFAFVAGDNDFALARYNTDGSLDTTFAGDGKTNTDFGTDDRANAVAIQGDGKIVAAGVSDVAGDNDFVMVRYQPNGTLDTTFSLSGTAFTDFAAGSNDEAFGVAIQGDGKIVAAGTAFVSGTGNDFALARYNTDGSLDATFSGDGKVTTDFTGTDDQALDVAIQGDGRIVAAGFAGGDATQDFALARYTCFRRTSRPTSIPIC